MKIGVYIFPTEYSISIVDLGCELEDRDFESLFVPEHTHIPASRKTPFPSGGLLPKEYSHTLDPFVALAAVAARTKKLRIGTGICLLTERDPIVTAKIVASLDQVSNGRFELGLGAGWNAEEMENHGTTYEHRFQIMVDRTKAMQTIWMENEAKYRGKFVEFDPIWSWPKPLQKPHPPILLGGETEHTLRRVVDFADGWFPRGSKLSNPKSAMDKLRYHAEKAGRDFGSLAVTVFRGLPEEAYLEECEAAGIYRVLLPLPSEDSDTVLPLLDKYEALLAK